MQEKPIDVQEEGMKGRDIILYIISRCQSRPAFGRTSLQKVAYFVGRAMDRDLGHRAYFYGPFASSVERETQALVLSELVEEKVQALGFANAGGFEAKQYEYRVTESGEERLKKLQDQYPSETEMIDLVIEALVENAGRLDQRLLSAAAKVDYIAKQEGRPVSVHDVQLAAKDLGWRLDEVQVSEVVEMLRKLGFVELINER
jgi:uncharacterized protein YwgA